MRDFSQTIAGCRSTPPPCASSGRLARRSSTAARARHPRDLAVARPGRRGRACKQRPGNCATSASTLSGYCRGGMFTGGRCRGRAGRARRQPARARRSLHAERALPGAGGRRPARRARRQGGARDIAARAPRSATASPRCSRMRASAGMPLAIEPLHPMYAADRACINTLEQALDVCDALDPRAAARSASPSTSTTCGGIRSSQQQIERAGSERLLAFHVCDWLTPTTDLLNDRGMMGDGVIDIRRHPRAGRGAGLRRLQRGRDLLRANWWQRDGDEVLDTCIERHRASCSRARPSAPQRSGGECSSTMASSPAMSG